MGEEIEVKRELVEKWKKWYLSAGHSLPSTNTYYSFITRYVDEEKLISQKKVNKFRMNNMSCPSSGSLKNFFRYLVDKEDYPTWLLNIKFDKNKSNNNFPKSISIQEVQVIIDNIENFKYKVLTKVLFELGLRVSEGIRLDWENFNWSEWLQKRGDSGKVNILKAKRDKYRVLPVSDERMVELYQLCPNKATNGVPIKGFVFNFGEELNQYLNTKGFTEEENLYRYIDAVKDSYRYLLENVSLRCIGKKVNPHMLRHSRAQFFMDNGMSIESLKELLGHSTISTTEIYAQASPEKVRKELKMFEVIKLKTLEKPQPQDVRLIKTEPASTTNIPSPKPLNTTG